MNLIVFLLLDAKAASVKPNMSEKDLVFLAEEVFNLKAQKVSPLPSYEDQNFLIQGATESEQFVLKISNSEEESGWLPMLSCFCCCLHPPFV